MQHPVRQQDDRAGGHLRAADFVGPIREPTGHEGRRIQTQRFLHDRPGQHQLWQTCRSTCYRQIQLLRFRGNGRLPLVRLREQGAGPEQCKCGRLVTGDDHCRYLVDEQLLAVRAVRLREEIEKVTRSIGAFRFASNRDDGANQVGPAAPEGGAPSP